MKLKMDIDASICAADGDGNTDTNYNMTKSQDEVEEPSNLYTPFISFRVNNASSNCTKRERLKTFNHSTQIDESPLKYTDSHILFSS